jgi:hypothetical protein
MLGPARNQRQPEAAVDEAFLHDLPTISCTQQVPLQKL